MARLLHVWQYITLDIGPRYFEKTYYNVQLAQKGGDFDNEADD